MKNIKADDATKIGRITALFPCYRTNNPEFAKLIKKIDSNNHLVKVDVLRQGSIVALVVDGEFCLNVYCFPLHCSDEKVVSYLKKNLGWTKDLLYRITIPTVYLNCREDVVSKGLYRWEDTAIPKVKISRSKVEKLIATYLATFKVTAAHSITYTLTKQDELGVCGVVRRSGLVSRAVEYCFEFNPKEIYLHSVLHEIAHALDYHLYRSWIHGPTFLILYANLLSDHFDMDALKELKKKKLFLGTG